MSEPVSGPSVRMPADGMHPRTRFTVDSSVRRYAGGRAVLGGSPVRLLRLSAAGTRQLDRWARGEPLGTGEAPHALARRLLGAGILHPLPPAGGFAAEDVTVVVPVRDGDLTALRAAVTEVGAVVVVDDGSAVPVAGARVRHAESRGPAAARNTGFRLAGTPLVAFLDADAVPETGWLQRLLPLFADQEVAAVAPRVRSRPGMGPLAGYEADRSSLDLGTRAATVRPLSRVGYVPTAALVVRASALSDVDGFDERLRFGEDVDLVWRLVGRGATVRYEPSATVWHAPRTTVRRWLRQRYDYGTSAAPLALRHNGLLACVRLGGWSAAGWALVLAGWPVAGAAFGAVTAALLPRKLRGTGVPTAAAVRLAVTGHLGAGRQLADALRRTWWPVALLHPHTRRLLALALLPCVVEAAAAGHGPRWLALRIADDLAYGAGVWAGCLRHRTPAPLLPGFTR